jgi:hypothetical protein
MATPLPLNIVRDINGYPLNSDDAALAFAPLAQYVLLVANTVTTVTVPQNPSPTFGGRKMLAKFVFGNPSGALSQVWVLPAATPTLTLPTTTVTETLSVLSPAAREVLPGQVLQLLTSQANIVVSISYYAIQ